MFNNTEVTMGCDCCCCIRCGIESVTISFRLARYLHAGTTYTLLSYWDCPCLDTAIELYPQYGTCTFVSEPADFCGNNYQFTLQVCQDVCVEDCATYPQAMYYKLTVQNTETLCGRTYENFEVGPTPGVPATLVDQCHCLPAQFCVYQYAYCSFGCDIPDIGTAPEGDGHPTMCGTAIPNWPGGTPPVHPNWEDEIWMLEICMTITRDPCDCPSFPPSDPPSDPPEEVKWYCVSPIDDCEAVKKCQSYTTAPDGACSGPYDDWASCVGPCQGLTPSIPPPPLLAQNPTEKSGTIPTPILEPISESIIELGGYPSGRRFHERFNGSICRFGDREYLAYRTDWAPESRIHIVEMVGGSPTGESITLNFPNQDAQEDPRLFVFKNELHVSFTVVKPNGKGWLTSMAYARLGADLQPLEVYQPKSPRGDKPQEKNWVFFEVDEELYCVYEGKPNHIVLKVRGDTTEIVGDTPNRIPWTGGKWHGGTPPIRVGDEFFHFFHGRREPGYHYNIGVYAFSAKPPFEVTRGTPQPLVWANKLTNPGNRYDVIFPAGAIYDNFWKVSAGIHDRSIHTMTWDHDEILKLMVKPRLSLPTLPPCKYEGGIVTHCTTCSGENRHLRNCMHPNPSGEWDLVARNHDDPLVHSCSRCPDYTRSDV